MSKRARAKAPATVANVACGFDIFGFALEQPFDEVTATLSDEAGARMIRIVGDHALPKEASKNTSTVAVNAMLAYLGTKIGVDLELYKNLPLASGLGSSAASAVAALVATNHVLGEPLTRAQMLPFAMEGERIACGTAHADNVAPSLIGGFVLIRSYEPLDVVSIPTPKELYCAIVHPDIKIRTEDARRMIRASIPLGLAVANWGNTAALIAGLYSGDYDLISRSLQDYIFEPDRSTLVPGFSAIKQAALDAGALGCSLSGSGPAIFALCSSDKKATQIAAAMKKACDSAGLKSSSFVSGVNMSGAQLMEPNR